MVNFHHLLGSLQGFIFSSLLHFPGDILLLHERLYKELHLKSGCLPVSPAFPPLTSPGGIAHLHEPHHVDAYPTTETQLCPHGHHDVPDSSERNATASLTSPSSAVPMHCL